LFNKKKKEEEEQQQESTFTTTYNEDEPIFDRETDIPLAESVSEPYDPPLDVEEQKVDHTEKKKTVLSSLDAMWNRATSAFKKDSEAEHAPLETAIPKQDNTGTAVNEYQDILSTEDAVLGVSDDDEEDITPAEKEARRAWKLANPNETIKKHRLLHNAGFINELPWNHPDYQDQLGLVADNSPVGSQGEVKGFGTQFPTNPVKGNMFLRVDQLPTALYKFNGNIWIEVDKELSDQHAYDTAYIDHLIAKIGSGEYDPDLLSDAEREQIENKLQNNLST